MDLSEGKLSEAITWNEEAQKLNPNLVETYISICDTHNQLKAYEKTLSLCRKALSLKGGVSEPDRASLQSLLGLAAFMRGEESSNSNLLKTSENYFLESLKYDPQMAKNYFYLGSLERDHFENDEEAQKYFKKGCDLKYQPCCDKLKEAASAQSKDESAPQQSPEIAKPAPLPLPTPVSPPQAPVGEVKKTDFGDLPRKDIDTVKRISSLYSKKGLTADQVQQLESGLAQQFKSMRPEDRAKGLEEFIKALTK
jgi:tetratricopeptide (TPR) repeat protein